MIDWLRRRFGTRKDRVSESWLKQEQRASFRNTFHGVTIRFPVKKTLNESPLWNRHKMRKGA